MESFIIQSVERTSFIPLTQQVQNIIKQHAWACGGLILFCPHTTCGLTINEGADPDVATDMTRFLNKTIPKNGDFRHFEGNADAHIKASLLGSSLYLIIEQSRICLGTWQTIYLFDGDGPRTRTIWLQWLGSASSS